MRNIRVIPRLDIKGPNLVKGIHLEGLRVLGRPQDFAGHYYESGADELMFVDVVASLYGRNSLDEIIRKTAREIFVPLTVGGGIRTIRDISTVLRAGADKVSINTAALNRPDFIKEASKRFGSSTIVVSVEAIRESTGQYLAYTDNGREFTGMDVLEWVQRIQELGAGEIVLTSVDREGTGDGFDLDLIDAVSKGLEIPLVVHGGAGHINQFKDVLELEVDGFAMASILHYGMFRKDLFPLANAVEGNTEFLRSGNGFSKISPMEIVDLKNLVRQKGLDCRAI
ncbi:MAG: imidazole glycerol phosphate synthase cyclase subunit [Cyclobacteriaceae bacterium]|nr:imidazole glycerol phosphate synthase cyclase subunit [Cyclobacteriaceae bacterium HetDA_MAG_MS6]